MRHILITLTLSILLARAVFAGDEAALRLDGVRGSSIKGLGSRIVVGITNVSRAPVKAFRASLLQFDDFDQAKQLCAIEFSSETKFTQDGKATNHYIIKPGETIYYSVTNTTLTGKTLIKASNAPEDDPIKGRFKLEMGKVVFAEQR
jgi:hypothetical protein